MGDDYHGMRRDRMNPMMEQGIIVNKCFLDWHRIQQLERNDSDPHMAQSVYPGGSKLINHNAMPGLMSMGLKNVRNYEVMHGEPNELGTVSVAGDEVPDRNQRAYEDQFYFQGFVVTEDQATNPLDLNSDGPNSGYTTVRCGAYSTVNNGRHPLYPGQFVIWQAPSIEDNVGRARDGRSYNPSLNWEMAPFDYTDFGLELNGALYWMKTASTDGGIQGMPFHRFFETYGMPDVPAYTCAQEETAGLKYGMVGAVLAGLAVLVERGLVQISTPAAAPNRAAAEAQVSTLADTIGLWANAPPVAGPNVWLDIVKRIFEADDLENPPSDHGGKTLQQWGNMTLPNSDNPTNNYWKLRAHLSKFTCAHLVGAWYHKTSKIIGRPLNASNPGETIHGLWGHFAL